MLRWWRLLRERDPSWHALRRSTRAAVVVPVNFAIGSQVFGSAQVATFAAFGSFALLLFVSFPGGPAARLGSYAVLGAAGVALISVGTALNSPSWLAVASMAVVGFAVLFSGAISSTINAATQAALLAYILALLLPASAADLPARLGGWFLALAVSVPVAVFVWPPDEQDVLRQRSAQLCRALAAMLALEQPPPGTGDSLVAMRRALTGLRDAFRASATRPAAVSTGTRLLIRLVDELEWLTTTVANACANAPEQWPEQGRRLRESSARAMAACASVLDHDGTGPTRTARIGLDERLADLDNARAAVSAEALAELRTSAELVADGPVSGEFERPLYAAHELGYAVALATRTIAMIAAADSRSWWVRLAGRRLDVDEVGPVVGAQRVAAGHFDRHSVWLQNSVRGAAGLTLAVLFARLFDAQNAFWIGLGALSVLRSTALSTGATIFRALAGTAVGFAIGAAIVSVLGTGHALLWSLLPLVILVAAYAPALRSFVAGQAAFTVFSIILFNLIVPSGWQVGVLRIEDVALGCLASLVAGFLFWPRGAGPALGGALAEAYRASADYLQESVGYLTGRVSAVNAGSEAAAAGLRMDDALRQYLAERGTKEVDLRSVVLLANGATRLRLAGTAIARLYSPDGQVPVPDAGLAEPLEVLDRRGNQVASWYRALADSFAGRSAALPDVPDTEATESFLDVVLPAVQSCGDPERAAGAERVLWSGQYLGDVDRFRLELLAPAEQVRAARA